MIGLGLLLLLVAGGLGYLSLVDRMSPLALQVVEFDSALPLASHHLAWIIGLSLLALGLRQRRAAQAAQSQRKEAKAARAAGPRVQAVQPGLGEGTFRAQVVERIQGMTLPDGARVRLDLGPGVVLGLTLTQMPQGRSERAIAGFAQLLSALPMPPRVRIQWRDCPPTGGPRHHAVTRLLGETLQRSSFRAVSNGDQVDVIFHTPDEVWTGW